MPDSQLLLTGSNEGNLKIYDVKTGGVKRLLQVTNLGLTSITELNDSNSVIVGSANNKIYIVNTTLGKATSSFDAHEDSVVGVFYSQKLNKIISDGKDSVYKIWDVNKKIPLQSYFDTDSPIITCDYRDEDGMHMCIDSDGAFALRNMVTDKIVLKFNMDYSNFYCARFDPTDLNKYYIANETSLDIFDLRMNRLVESISDWNDAKLFTNEGNYFLVADQENDALSLREYGNYGDYLSKFEKLGKVSHIRYRNIKNKQMQVIICGNKDGDVFYQIDL